MISAADIGDNELAFIASADVAEVGFLEAIGNLFTGADKKRRRTKAAQKAAMAATQEADELTRQAGIVTRGAATRRDAAIAAAKAKAEMGVLDDLKSRSATGVPAPSWAVAAGGAALAWAVAPGRLAIPAALAVGVGLAWWDHAHKRGESETGAAVRWEPPFAVVTADREGLWDEDGFRRLSDARLHARRVVSAGYGPATVYDARGRVVGRYT